MVLCGDHANTYLYVQNYYTNAYNAWIAMIDLNGEWGWGWTGNLIQSSS